MSSLSLCPECRQQVAIPDGADAAARVRCPHCHAEFPLSDTLADRVDGPPDVILVTPLPAEATPVAGPAVEAAPAETPLVAGPLEEAAPPETPLGVSPAAETAPAETVVAETARDEVAPAGPPAIEVSQETVRLDQEALELAEEASALQSRAEGLQVTAHTSDPEPEAAATQAEALEEEARDLAAKVEAIADPVESPDKPTARPVTVVGAYRAMGGALLAAADALDAVAEVVERKGIASQPEAAEPSPVAELKSDLAEAIDLGKHHDEIEDETIDLELSEPILEDESPLPTSDEEPLFAEEPSVPEPAAGELAATEPTIAEPAAAEQTIAQPATAEPAASGSPDAEPVRAGEETDVDSDAGRVGDPSSHEADLLGGLAIRPTGASTPPPVGANPLLLKSLNLRCKAEALRTRGEGLLTKADALKAAAGVTDEDLEPGEEGQGGEYALHGDWAAGGVGQPAGQSAATATAPGARTLPFPVTPRKQRKPKSALREFISIALGGVTGLLLTYLVLNLVSDQYEFGICPHWLHVFHTAAPDKSSSGPKSGKPAQPKEAKSPSPAKPGQGAQVAQGGHDKKPAAPLDPLPSLPEMKPMPADSPSGDNVPTTLPSGDTLPPPAATPSKPAETEPPPPVDDAKFGKVVDMAKPPAYGSDEIAWRLKSAQDAFKGDLQQGNYLPLCRLAEAVTFIDPQKGVTGLGERKAAVEKLLRDVGERDKHKNVKIIAQLADKWLDNPERECAGILLAGRIQKIGKTGSGRPIAIVALAKPDKSAPTERTIKMLSQEPLLGLKEQDAVIVLGGLGVGGQGDRKELVVIHGMTIKFAVPAAKAK
jgi:hypothetical protein